VKKTVGALALVAALLLCGQSVLAQNYKGTPKPTIQDYGPFANTKVRTAHPAWQTEMCGNPAAACLFYGGDFELNPVGPNLANGVANENTLEIAGSPYGAAIWVPFTVPNGQTWLVSGLFGNNFSSYGVLDQSPNQPIAAAYWAIQEGIEPGIPGTIVASGTSAATSTATGGSSFDLNEYTIEVRGLSVTLTGGTYWMAVVPICTNTGNPYCGGVFFLADTEYVNTTPKNAYGPAEPLYSSYFDAAYFGYSYAPTNGPLGAAGGIGGDAFSAGVLGHRKAAQ